MHLLRAMATTAFFDDDLYDFGGAEDGGFGAFATAGDFEDFSAAGDDLNGPAAAREGSGAASNSGSLATLSSHPRRKRGARGGAGSHFGGSGVGKGPRWRSGAVPIAPSFDGDIEADPYCYRHYKRRLERWVMITREFLPPNEQALRALEQLKGEAELEFEEVSDTRFNCENGIKILLDDLQSAFGEKEIFRQGGTIREFENITRLQGESVTAFTRRFRLLERKLADNKVPAYPEAARVIKLLDGLRLDEKSTANLLLAAGNRYDMAAIQEAIRVQFPAGLSITGLPRLRPDLRRGRGTTMSSRSSASASTRSTAPSTKGMPRRWKQWNTFCEEDGAIETWVEEATLPEEAIEPETLADDSKEAEDVPAEGQDPNDDDVEAEDPWDDNWEAAADDGIENALWDVAESLTVTSKKLAGLVQARGYYSVDGKGGGKGPGKQKGKSKAKGKGKSLPKGKGKAGSKGKGKLDNPIQQQRLKGSLCLGCGSADHWLRDCPFHTVQNAQMASASYDGMTLDAEGNVSSWTVSAHEKPSASPARKAIVCTLSAGLV